MPMAFISGKVDQLANPSDISWLLDEEQSGLRVGDYLLKHEQYNFGHTGAIMSIDMDYFLDDFLPLIYKHNKEAVRTKRALM